MPRPDDSAVLPGPRERAGVRVHVAVGLVVAAALLLEVLLTRLLAIAVGPNATSLVVALFALGTGFGTLAVFVLPRRLRDTVPWLPAATTLLLAATVLPAVAFPLFVPGGTLPRLAALVVVIALPFALFGVTFAALLRRFPRESATLYAADLFGAAGGTLIALGVLHVLSAEAAALVAAPLAALAAVLLATRRRGLTLAVAALVCALAAGVAQSPQWRLRHTFMGPVDRAVAAGAERLDLTWNPVAMTEVIGPIRDDRYFHGISHVVADPDHEYLALRSDGTVLEAPALRFDGRRETLDRLTHDVSYLGFHARPAQNVFVIGAGGGIDVLAAWRMGVPRIVTAEHNPDVRELVDEIHGDYTGRPFSLPGVDFVADDARTVLRRTSERFDQILLARVGFWRASGVTGFVLAENTIHTREAYDLYLDRLRADGLLVLVEYDTTAFRPSFLRHTAQLLDALRRDGATRPEDHVFVAGMARHAGIGFVTTIASRRPLDADTLARLHARVAADGFALRHAPDAPGVDVTGLLTDAGREQVEARYGIELAPPTDDRPFFDNYLRFRDHVAMTLGLRPPPTGDAADLLGPNLEVLRTLYRTIGIVLVLALLALALPAAVIARRGGPRCTPMDAVHFAALGVGFFAVEIPLISRMKLFLGSPLHSVGLVIFALLICAGLGSRWAARIDLTPRAVRRASWTVAAAVLLFLLGVPHVLAACAGTGFAVRCAVVVVLLLPMGFVLGLPFPLGLRMIAARDAGLLPWTYAVNSFASVAGSLCAYALALHAGYSATLGVAVAAYVVAGLAAARIARRAAHAEPRCTPDPASPPAPAAARTPRGASTAGAESLDGSPGGPRPTHSR